MDKLVYSIREVQEALGISRGSVRRLIHDGALQHVRLGRRVLVPAAALQALLERSATPGLDEAA